jgi:hypothetical protein
MIELLGSLVSVCEVVRKWFPPKTKLGSFQEFLDVKSKQAGKLLKKRNLNTDQVINWHKVLSCGLAIALGSDVRNGDIKLNCDIMQSRIDSLKFYGSSQTTVDLKRILCECIGLLGLIRKDVLPEVLSPQFEPHDLKKIAKGIE